MSRLFIILFFISISGCTRSHGIRIIENQIVTLGVSDYTGEITKRWFHNVQPGTQEHVYLTTWFLTNADGWSSCSFEQWPKKYKYSLGSSNFGMVFQQHRVVLSFQKDGENIKKDGENIFLQKKIGPELSRWTESIRNRMQ